MAFSILGTALPIPQDPAEPPAISMNNFTVDNIITGSVLAAGGYPTGAAASRPDIYRPSCNQPIVSQPYPTNTSIPQTVFPPTAAVPAVEDIYNARAWYTPDLPQTSPIDYQQPQRFDNRSPTCVQPNPVFRETYKPYGYDCKY